MGWRLVEEILGYCPDLKYRQFRVLVALALDARDSTRQGMPGMELLTLHGNCGMRTTQRAMHELTTAGLVKMIKAPAPHRRAVYEILPLATDDSMMSPVRTSEPGQRTPETRKRTPPTMASSQSDPRHRPSSSLARAAGIIRQALPGATDGEIEIILTRIREHKPRNLIAYVTKLAANGDLVQQDETCDTDGDQAHSQACRQGDSVGCTAKWCKCRCHSGQAQWDAP